MKVDPKCVGSAAGDIGQEVSAQLVVQPGVVVSCSTHRGVHSSSEEYSTSDTNDGLEKVLYVIGTIRLNQKHEDVNKGSP